MAQSSLRTKFSIPPPGALYVPRHTSAHQVVYFRFASTVTPNSVAAQPTDGHIPPPHQAQRGNKKIELKPGPVKPSTLRIDSIPSRRPSQDSTSPSYYRPPRHNKPPKPIESSLSALALAKQDITSAAERGVLEPPPKDATPFKRFTHQALQLLVCNQSFFHFWVDTRSAEILLQGSQGNKYPQKASSCNRCPRKIWWRFAFSSRATLHRNVQTRCSQVSLFTMGCVCNLISF